MVRKVAFVRLKLVMWPTTITSQRACIVTCICIKAWNEVYLTIRPVARKGYELIAHEPKPNELLTRGPSRTRKLVN